MQPEIILPKDILARIEADKAVHASITERQNKTNKQIRNAFIAAGVIAVGGTIAGDVVWDEWIGLHQPYSALVAFVSALEIGLSFAGPRISWLIAMEARATNRELKSHSREPFRGLSCH